MTEEKNLSRYFLIIALGAAIIGALLASKTLFGINKKVSDAKEATRPATVVITKITAPNCADCFNVDAAIATLKKQNVLVGEEKTIAFDSEEGQTLIKNLGITRVPTYVFSGEIKKGNLEGFIKENGEVKNNTFVFTKAAPVFIDTATGKVRGRVELVLLTDITCVECYDVTQHEIILKQFGINATAKVADIKSDLGRTLVKAYAIKMVPAFVLSGDVKDYPSLISVWPRVGFVARDGAYVFTKGVPFMGVYKNLETNKIISPKINPAPQQ